MRIKLTPEEVHQVAGQFKQGGQQSQDIVSHLQQVINQLQPDWEGMTQQRFYTEFQQARNQMSQYVQLLNSISQQLDAIANRFTAVDQAQL